MIFKVLGNSVNLNSASNVGSATLVRIVNTTAAEKTITVDELENIPEGEEVE